MPRATIGQRDKKVMIQVGTPRAGASKLPITDWVDSLEVWMRRRDASGTERLASAQTQASVDTEWEMPYLSSMDPEQIDVPKLRRLKYAGRTYDIKRAVLGDFSEGRSIRLFTLARSG